MLVGRHDALLLLLEPAGRRLRGLGLQHLGLERLDLDVVVGVHEEGDRVAAATAELGDDDAVLEGRQGRVGPAAEDVAAVDEDGPGQVADPGPALAVRRLHLEAALAVL